MTTSEKQMLHVLSEQEPVLSVICMFTLHMYSINMLIWWLVW